MCIVQMPLIFFISDYNMSDKPQKINPSQQKCVTCRYLGCLCVPKHCLRACDFLQVWGWPDKIQKCKKPNSLLSGTILGATKQNCIHPCKHFHWPLLGRCAKKNSTKIA